MRSLSQAGSRPPSCESWSHQREQADLSAEQPSSGQEARLPSAHAHPRRPRDPQRSSWQGPPRAVGLTSPDVSLHTVLVARRSMLPQRHRLRRSSDFTAVMRGGQRAARNTVVVHMLVPGAAAGPPRFGLVVGRTVGNSVARHQVSRRLRGVLAGRTERFPAGADVVVRARPEAASADSAQLAGDVDGALATLLRRRPSGRGVSVVAR
jgi:ribonuclease P protein component